MKLLNRFLAKTIAGLSILPALRGAAVDTQFGPLPSTEDIDHFADTEVEIGHSCVVREELAAKYVGALTTLEDQLAALSKISGKGLRFKNACFSGRAELDAFIAERTR